MKERPHVSATQLESYARCGEAYRRRYVQKEVIPPGIAAIVGKGFHGAAQRNFRQKLETREDLPLADIQGIAAEEFDLGLAGGYLLNEEEVARGANIVVGEAKDRVITFAAGYATIQAPEYQPVLVEEAVTIALPGSHDLLGIIDLTDTEGRVTDFKTGSKRKTQTDADDSIQLTVYAAAYAARFDEPPSGLRLDTLVNLKKGVERQVLDTTRTARDVEVLANRISTMLAGVKKGVFSPATPGAWWCGPKWCGYWNTCPFVNSERRAAAEGGS